MRLSDLVTPRWETLKPVGGCSSCPRKLVDHVPPTLRETQIILVGEAPGAVEVERKEGFVGRSGQLLRRTLRQYGLQEWSFTNTIHCRPPKNRTPTTREVSCCLNQFVLQELEGYPLVVLIGGTATTALYPKHKFAHMRGNLAAHPDFPGQRFYSTYHSAYAMRSPEGMKVFEAQIERLARIVRAGVGVPFDIIQGPQMVERMRAAVTEHSQISLDLETNQLESWIVGGRIISLALCVDPKEAFFCHEDEPHFVAVLDILRDILEDPSKQLLGHHIGFDLVWLESELDVVTKAKIILDTGVLFYQWKGWKMSSLKQLVAQELDGYRCLIPSPHTEKDAGLIAQYNCEDVVYSLQLHRKAFPKLGPLTQDLYIRVAGPSDPSLQRITHEGIHFNTDLWNTHRKALKDERAQEIQAWKDEDPQFIPEIHEKGKGLIEYLYEVKKYPPIKITTSGKRSTDNATIKALIRNNAAPQLNHQLRISAIDKRLSTYVEGYEKWIGSDGRVHADYHNTTTDTGRLSSRRPNSQNIPRDPEIRNFFGVPAGYRLIEGDLNQIEFRIVSCLAGEKNAIEGYQAGLDVHTLTAQAITGRQDITKEDRTKAKSVNFALIYGGTGETIRTYARDTYDLELSQTEADRFCETFFSTYPKIRLWHTHCRKELLKRKGWIESVVGHTTRYNDWNSQEESRKRHAENASINMRGQGPAAYIMTYLISLTQQGFHEQAVNARVVGTVHDSLLIEAHEDEWEDAIHVIQGKKRFVESWIKHWFIVPLEIDFAVGTLWGELEPWS